MYLFIFIAFICQNLFFEDGVSGHFGLTPLEKNAGTFTRDIEANFKKFKEVKSIVKIS